MMNFVVAVALVATGLLVVVPPGAQEEPPPREPPLSAKQTAQTLLCDQPPCPPTTLDSQKTADTLEGAKEFVGDRLESAKESVEDAYQHVKDSVHETSEKAKHAMLENIEKAKHGMQETNMAASYIPRKESKEMLVLHADESDPATYIMPGIGQNIGSLKRKLDDGTPDASTLFGDSPALDSLKTKVEQASTYVLSPATVASHIKDKVHEMQQATGDMSSEVKKTIGGMRSDAVDKKAECMDNLSGFLQGLREKLTRSIGKKGDSDGLETRVHELCSSMLEDGERIHEGANMGTKSDGSALHESYAYLMESALNAIDGAKEVFEKAIEREGVESREKYMYLAETARGAVQGAKEVFDRATITLVNDIQKNQEGLGGQTKSLRKDATAPVKVGHLMTSLKETALHTKHRVSATICSLVRTLYLASFSAAFGVTFWITFFSGHLLSRALPRHQLALVQSKLFPIYLRMVTGCMATCAVSHMVLHPWPNADWWENLQHLNFSFSLVVSLCNTLIIEPKITKIMFEKLKIEKEEGRGQSGEAMDDETMARLASVDVKFKGLHQVASFANLASVAGLAWHLWYLANRLMV